MGLVKTGLKRLAGSGLVLFMLSGACLALEVEGSLVDMRRNMILVETAAAGHEAIIVGGETRLINWTHADDLMVGERLRARYEEEAGGVKLAREIEADPFVEIPSSAMIAAGELAARIEAKDGFLLFDVRPRGQFEAGHIPGAVSMPLAGFDPSKLPKKKNTLIVFYSESPRDPAALDAMRRAAKLKYTSPKVYGEGLFGWERAKKHTAVAAGYVKKLLDAEAPLVIVDARERQKAAGEHLPGAYLIPQEEFEFGKVKRDNLPAYPVFLYDGNGGIGGEAWEVAVATAHGNYGGEGESSVNVIEGGLEAWKAAGYPVEEGSGRDPVAGPLYAPKPESGIVTRDEFRAMWAEKGGGKVILDIRAEAGGPVAEFVTFLPIEELPYRIGELPADKEIIIFCAVGYRARIAYHILKNNGFNARYLNEGPSITPEGVLY